jgi:hypothetical protein
LSEELEETQGRAHNARVPARALELDDVRKQIEDMQQKRIHLQEYADKLKEEVKCYLLISGRPQ